MYPVPHGTRTQQGVRKEHPQGRSITRTMNGDLGMSKNVTAALTFNAGTGQVTAANGTFSAFAAGDPVVFQGTNLNNGEFTITGIDAVNAAYLQLDPAPKSEGPVTALARTP